MVGKRTLALSLQGEKQELKPRIAVRDPRPPAPAGEAGQQRGGASSLGTGCPQGRGRLEGAGTACRKGPETPGPQPSPRVRSLVRRGLATRGKAFGRQEESHGPRPRECHSESPPEASKGGGGGEAGGRYTPQRLWTGLSGGQRGRAGAARATCRERRAWATMAGKVMGATPKGHGRRPRALHPRRRRRRGWLGLLPVARS